MYLKSLLHGDFQSSEYCGSVIAVSVLKVLSKSNMIN